MARIASPPVTTISSACRGRPPRSTSEASAKATASASSSQRYAVSELAPRIQFAAASTATPAAIPASIVQIAASQRAAA